MPLSAKQHQLLADLVHKYRRQIGPTTAAELTEKLLPPPVLADPPGVAGMKRKAYVQLRLFE